MVEINTEPIERKLSSVPIDFKRAQVVSLHRSSPCFNFRFSLEIGAILTSVAH
jgi:hypothetical protein